MGLTLKRIGVKYGIDYNTLYNTVVEAGLRRRGKSVEYDESEVLKATDQLLVRKRTKLEEKAQELRLLQAQTWYALLELSRK